MKNKSEYRRIIEKIAENHNISPNQAEAEMTAAINTAWQNQTDEQKAFQTELFGDSEPPAPGEFINKIAKLIKKETVE